MKRTKWIRDTKISRKLYKGKILDSRLDHEAEEFDIKVEYDDGQKPSAFVEATQVLVNRTLASIYTEGSLRYIADNDDLMVYDGEGWVRLTGAEESENQADRAKSSGSRELDNGNN